MNCASQHASYLFVLASTKYSHASMQPQGAEVITFEWRFHFPAKLREWHLLNPGGYILADADENKWKFLPEDPAARIPYGPFP